MTNQNRPKGADRRRLENVGRAARSWACRRCGSPTYRGLDDDAAACEARTDVYPLSNVGEIQALLAERFTYELRWVAARARYELDRRDAFRISARPAEQCPADIRIVVEHRCHSPRFDSLRLIRAGIKTSAKPVGVGAPPF